MSAVNGGRRVTELVDRVWPARNTSVAGAEQKATDKAVCFASCKQTTGCVVTKIYKISVEKPYNH